MNPKEEKTKYDRLWRIGTVLAFVLYYSGSVWAFTRLRRALKGQYRAIVLMYHRVRDDDLDRDMRVRSHTFERQMRYLTKHYTVLPLDQLVGTATGTHRLRRDTVAITFDDGFHDNYTNAFAILKKFDLPATIFVVTDAVDRDPQMLHSANIQKMQRHGIRFGAHTMTHPILADLDADAAWKEILGAKNDLEKITADPVHFFAYPKGKRRHFDSTSQKLVKKAGFRAAFSTENGCISPDSNIYALERIGIRECPLFVFKARISGIFESRLLMGLRKGLKMT